MRGRTKGALILFSTLLIGVLIGILLSGWFVRDRLRPIPHSRHFVRSTERLIAPQDEEQRQAVRTVLRRHAAALRELNAKHREALKEQLDSSRAELAPLLSEEQLRRLDRRQRRFGELMGPWRERPHHKKKKSHGNE